MNALSFLIGGLVLFIALLVFGFIVLIWGLKQLLTVRNQNDTMIYLLETISLNIWNEAYTQAGLQEEMEGSHAQPGAEVRAA
jgi:uncharacterized membrane protein